MNKLGKILGPIVALLSIAAAVLSFLIAEQRTLFRDRAATLAGTVASMTEKLDEGSDSNLKNKVTFNPASANSPKEGGTLGWENYKQARKDATGAYDKTVKQAVDLSEKVQKQRNDLAAGLLEVAVTLGYPAKVLPPAAEMTSLAKYGETVPKVNEFAKGIMDRDQQILKNINSVAGIVRTSVPGGFMKRQVEKDATGKNVLKPYNVQSAFVPMRNAVQQLNSREQELVRAVTNTVSTIKAYKGWTVSTRQLNRTPHKVLKTQLAKFNNDCRKINTQLAQVAVWKKDLQRMQKQKKDYEKKISSLKDEKEALEKKLAEFEKKFGNHSNDVEESVREETKPVLSKKIDVPLNLAGKILKVNKELNYVMIDLNNRQVVKDLSLAVVRNGAYIATIVIYEAGNDFSMANILSGDLSQLKADDDVIISALDLKKIKDIKEGKTKEKED